jgi:hypothetical protein
MKKDSLWMIRNICLSFSLTAMGGCLANITFGKEMSYLFCSIFGCFIGGCLAVSIVIKDYIEFIKKD